MKLQFTYWSIVLFLVACGNGNPDINAKNGEGKPTKEALIIYQNEVATILNKEGTSYKEFIAKFDETITILTSGNYTYEVNFVELESMCEVAKESNQAAIDKLKKVEEIIPSVGYQKQALRLTKLSQVLVNVIEDWMKGLKETQDERNIENSRDISEVKAKLKEAQVDLKAAQVQLDAMIKGE